MSRDKTHKEMTENTQGWKLYECKDERDWEI